MAEGGLQEEIMADKHAMDVGGDESSQLYLTGTAASQKKKSCFQITSVKVSENTNNDDAESMDELDESHAEDVSSDLLDMSKNTSQDLDQSNEDLMSPEIIKETLPPTVNGNNQGNGPSRFRVVKIETTEPIKRGRWTCTDFLDPAEKPKEPKVETINVPERTVEIEPGSGNSSAASSVHYTAGQDAITENPVVLPVSEQPTTNIQPQVKSTNSSTPTQNPTPQQNQQNIPTSQQNTGQNNAQPQGGNQNQGQEAVQSSVTQSQPASTLPGLTDYSSLSMMEHIRDTLNVNDMSSGAPSTDGQSEGEDSASGASVGAIDNKIEQAMDLVKSHLMYAVREEVEVLKEQIKELLERNSQLEKENTLLRQQQVQVVTAQQTPGPVQQQQQQQQQPPTNPAQQQPQMQSTATQSKTPVEQPSLIVATQSATQS
ncbi:uncharacterized protein LOC100370433 [Saccoglossus kowalevskii]|uniref:TSC22 domain family protein 1-like n=1 Tax=Saccoglossus kowalevskii TaxID=10224 RepID=A0ABM0GY08_SACKO|nr:PREDICTED: TSC22 domain family protein 1-like [Saccoglossus kowalevskii]